jgi:hypothetical protein
MATQLREFFTGSLGLAEDKAELLLKVGKVSLSLGVIYVLYCKYRGAGKKSADFEGPYSYPFLGHIPHMDMECLSETTSRVCEEEYLSFSYSFSSALSFTRSLLSPLIPSFSL